MMPQPNHPSPASQPATQIDAELECYLCLAAAAQACPPQPTKLATERRTPSEPAFLRGLHALLKGLRRSERNRVA